MSVYKKWSGAVRLSLVIFRIWSVPSGFVKKKPLPILSARGASLSVVVLFEVQYNEVAQDWPVDRHFC